MPSPSSSPRRSSASGSVVGFLVLMEFSSGLLQGWFSPLLTAIGTAMTSARPSCIERNAVGASRALSAARMALYGNGIHRVTLDAVIETMRQTGADMSHKYKETALGGLVVNVVEC